VQRLTITKAVGRGYFAEIGQLEKVSPATLIEFLNFDYLKLDRNDASDYSEGENDSSNGEQFDKILVNVKEKQSNEVKCICKF